jgi:hypothetical protein
MSVAVKQHTRPSVVTAAVWLLVASFAAGQIRLQVAKGGLTSASSVVVLLVFIGIVYAIARGLYVGKNWLRWLSIVGIFGGLLFLPWSLQTIHPGWDRVTYVGQGFVQGVAATLLLLPASGRWYRSS